MIGPGLASTEVDVGLGQQVDGPHHALVPETPRLPQRLLRREGRAAHAEELSGLLLVDHVCALEDGRVAYHGPAADYLEARVAQAQVVEIVELQAWKVNHG